MQGHFGAYVPAGPSQIFTTTGPVQAAPNETAGMHVNRLSPRVTGLAGMETYFNFSPQPTDWFSGIPNGFVVVGGIIAVIAMTR